MKEYAEIVEEGTPSEYFVQLRSQFLRQIEYQFRLQHLLQEVIVIPVIGIEVLSADDLEHAPLARLAAASLDGIERIVET
jgi:hypothetical protein